MRIRPASAPNIAETKSKTTSAPKSNKENRLWSTSVLEMQMFAFDFAADEGVRDLVARCFYHGILARYRILLVVVKIFFSTRHRVGR